MLLNQAQKYDVVINAFECVWLVALNTLYTDHNLE
jgi:hypothetical protein